LKPKIKTIYPQSQNQHNLSTILEIDRDGLGGLEFDEVLEVGHRSKLLLFLHDMVKATVADLFDGGGIVHEGPAVAKELGLRVREQKMNCISTLWRFWLRH